MFSKGTFVLFWSLVDFANGSIPSAFPSFGRGSLSNGLKVGAGGGGGGGAKSISADSCGGAPSANGLKVAGSAGSAGVFWFSIESVFGSLSKGLKLDGGGGVSGSEAKGLKVGAGGGGAGGGGANTSFSSGDGGGATWSSKGLKVGTGFS